MFVSDQNTNALSIKTCEIMQQLAYMDTNDLTEIETRIKNLTNLKTYAVIIHDKDTNEDGTPKAPHFHAVLTFNKPTKMSTVANGIHIKPQYVNKIKTTTTAAEAYLIHANDPDKFQYPSDQVHANFDYPAKIEKWLNPPEKQKSRLDEIIEGIDSGAIREYNYTDHISMQEYTRYKRTIDSCFAFRRDRLRGIERNMKAIFIYGESGTGKTTLAKRMATQDGSSCFVSSGSNDVLDGYQGQDVIILDDLRPSCLGLSDLLKLLDNNTASTVKSRYANKVLECKAIYITTTQQISTFFRNVFKEDPESAVQLMRRCETMIHMTAPTIDIYAYNPTHRAYQKMTSMPNPVEFVRQSFSKEQAKASIRALLGGLVEGIDTYLDHMDEYEQITIPDEELPF